MNWHQLSTAKVLESVHSYPKGLSAAEATNRIKQIGPNELQEGKKRSIAMMLLAQFKEVMILILLAAAVISGIMGDLTDTIVILVIVILNAVTGFLQEYRAAKAMQALKQMAITQVRVLRDGITAWLPATVLVPGDVILLEAGNAVTADVRIIESFDLSIDEAALTGESQPVEKITGPLEASDLPIGDKKNMAYKGTFVTYGRGKGVVIATGMDTELGRIAKMLMEEETATPLQERMASFGKKLSLIVLLLCVVFLVAGLLRGENITAMALTSISLAVAAIPEALPVVITISLALAAKRLISSNTLVRKLPAVEALGSVTYICTDKTGTLTKNQMHVEQVYVNGQMFETDSLSSVKDQDKVSLLLHAFALNNNATENADKELKGDSTEIALMEVAIANGIKGNVWPRLKEIDFDAKRKLMTTFHSYQGKIISFTKGAPDVLLKRCLGVDDALLQKQIYTMASEGQRILGFAFKYWSALPDNTDVTIHEHELQFLGLAGMIDPPRDEVYQAVRESKSAGITPVMITGDHPLTAKTIAQRIGIIDSENDMLLTGKELANLSDERFSALVEKIKVYARVSPEQKQRIIKALQQKGHYVAMTGDGVNDAPSLQKANIGIAMGITGTDVSKEAADMILLDDNFSTIIKAVREGRRIYDNILKFIKYLMTTNSSELLTLLIGPFLGLPLALLPIHILWINLVSDGLPAIALSYEKAEKDIMERPPRPAQQSVFANGRGVHIIWVGILMASVTLGMQEWAIKNELHWQTIVFNVLCLSQMGHVLAIRSEKQTSISRAMFSNKLLIGSVLFVLVLQLAITYMHILQPIFHTEALSVKEFIAVGISSSIVFFAVEIEKAFRR